MDINALKSVKSNTPILDYLLSKYETLDDIPVAIPVDVNGKYEQGYLQIFKTVRRDVKPAEKETVIEEMIKEHKKSIEMAMIHNELSCIIDNNPSVIPATYMPSLTEVISKVKDIPSLLRVQSLKGLFSMNFKDLDFGLIRFANDNRGNRALQLVEEEYTFNTYLNDKTFLSLALISDIGITCKQLELC